MRRVLISTLACAVAFASAGSRGGHAATAPLPDALSDAAYWQLITDASEPNGFFRSENLVSNERTYQYVIPRLVETAAPGGVYLGVAPDQNFAYIIAVRPRMAFIVDIRRGNLLEHLMYKAILERSPDRASFVSHLFSRPEPQGLAADASPAQLFEAFDRQQGSQALFEENFAAMRDGLITRHHFALSDDDVAQLRTIYAAFFTEGPGLRYSPTPAFISGGTGSGVGLGRFGVAYADFPSYEELQQSTDAAGRNRGYLGSEASYQALRTFESRNLLVPIVGDFAGPRAIRAVGEYVRAHGAVVSAFYVSNVEQYLFEDGVFETFARNVATLPVDGRSTFIRSVWTRFGYDGRLLGPDGRASALDPIRLFVQDVFAGNVRSYYDLNVRSK